MHSSLTSLVVNKTYFSASESDEQWISGRILLCRFRILAMLAMEKVLGNTKIYVGFFGCLMKWAQTQHVQWLGPKAGPYTIN